MSRTEIIRTEAILVKVTSGKLPCVGVCYAVPVKLGEHLFHVDFFILPLEEFEAVMGFNWLRTLGKMQMQFFREGAVVNWQGESNPKPPHRLLETALLEEDIATLTTRFLSFVSEDKHDLM